MSGEDRPDDTGRNAVLCQRGESFRPIWMPALKASSNSNSIVACMRRRG